MQLGPGLPDGQSPQVFKVGNITSSTLILNTGAPQGCVLSLLLYYLYIHGCVASHSFNSIIKFTDDTTVVGLITNDNKTAYREEVDTLAVWCHVNNLSLNVSKNKGADCGHQEEPGWTRPNPHQQGCRGDGQ